MPAHIAPWPDHWHDLGPSAVAIEARRILRAPIRPDTDLPLWRLARAVWYGKESWPDWWIWNQAVAMLEATRSRCTDPLNFEVQLWHHAAGALKAKLEGERTTESLATARFYLYVMLAGR